MRKLTIIVAVVAAFAVAGCQDHGRVPPKRIPSPAPVAVNIDSVPWCLSDTGSATTYPCKWDATRSPAPNWDRTVPKVALFVRSSDGCPLPLPQGVSCYWAPVDR